VSHSQVLLLATDEVHYLSLANRKSIIDFYWNYMKLMLHDHRMSRIADQFRGTRHRKLKNMIF